MTPEQINQIKQTLKNQGYNMTNVIKFIPDDEQAGFIRKFIHHPRREIREGAILELQVMSDSFDTTQFIPDLEQLRDQGRGPTHAIECTLSVFNRRGANTTKRIDPVTSVRQYMSAVAPNPVGSM